MTAVRYVELNPVAARLAARAEDWPWSSARAHVSGKADGLTDLAALAGVHRNWRAMLRHGLEGAILRQKPKRKSSPTSAPGGRRRDEAFIERLEAMSGRRLKRKRPGPKPKSS